VYSIVYRDILRPPQAVTMYIKITGIHRQAIGSPTFIMLPTYHYIYYLERYLERWQRIQVFLSRPPFKSRLVSVTNYLDGFMPWQERNRHGLHGYNVS
jgi:hypothetical protein